MRNILYAILFVLLIAYTGSVLQVAFLFGGVFLMGAGLKLIVGEL